MANNFQLAQKYLAKLDSVYKAESLTAFLDSKDDDVSFVGAKTVKVYKTTMDGLADYDRDTGYVQGSINGTWETFELTQDRGITFSIDVMDQDETMNMASTAVLGGKATALDRAFGRSGGEFVRTKVVPEVDAYRFSTYASASNSLGETGTLDTSDKVVKAIDKAESDMTDAEVPTNGRIMFITPACYSLLKQNGAAVGRSASMSDRALNRNFDTFDGMPVIQVPQSRFFTKIKTNDGSTKFGFEQATGSLDIHFMILHPSAIMQVIKHATLKVFTPNENQSADGYKIDYRIYHDAFTYDNKSNGIYVYKKAASTNPSTPPT